MCGLSNVHILFMFSNRVVNNISRNTTANSKNILDNTQVSLKAVCRKGKIQQVINKEIVRHHFML